MKAKSKFKMPSDKQIWLEVDEQLAAYPKVLAEIRGLPDRQALFDKKKAWYNDTPKREQEQAELQVKLAKSQAAAAKVRVTEDKAYLSLRLAQGKPIITVKQLMTEFPNAVEKEVVNLSQQKLHVFYEFMVLLADAFTIKKHYSRLKAASTSLTYKYLSQTYGLYRKIVKSEAASSTFGDIRALLWNRYKIKTHADIPNSSLLLKFIFEGISEKTIHLYTRSIQLADGYDVQESEFEDFIKQIGGMEKIRKAYATVKAADAGEVIDLNEKDDEFVASRNTLLEIEAFKTVELTAQDGWRFQNDLFGARCLVLASIDAPDNLELFGQIPVTRAIENEIIKYITELHKKNGSVSWLKIKASAKSLKSKRMQEVLVKNAEAQEAKKAKAAKKAVNLKKKNEAFQKKISKS